WREERPPTCTSARWFNDVASCEATLVSVSNGRASGCCGCSSVGRELERMNVDRLNKLLKQAFKNTPGGRPEDGQVRELKKRRARIDWRRRLRATKKSTCTPARSLNGRGT